MWAGVQGAVLAVALLAPMLALGEPSSVPTPSEAASLILPKTGPTVPMAGSNTAGVRRPSLLPPPPAEGSIWLVSGAFATGLGLPALGVSMAAAINADTRSPGHVWLPVASSLLAAAGVSALAVGLVQRKRWRQWRAINHAHPPKKGEAKLTAGIWSACAAIPLTVTAGILIAGRGPKLAQVGASTVSVVALGSATLHLILGIRERRTYQRWRRINVRGS